MPLTENYNMKVLQVLFAASLLIFTACGPSEEEQKIIALKNDSIEKKKVKDSLIEAKKKNPLIIIEPDSTYSGDFLERYDNGIVKFKGYYRFGKRHGQWLSFYPNGNQWSEMFYDKGKMQGSNTTFYSNGKMRYKGYYNNNLQDSTWEYYDTVGVLLQTIKYKNDAIVSEVIHKK
jgi:antitoxin component YwqK of YwqJK toxin-antitoxin module